MPLPTVMEFEIISLGTELERRVCKDFLFPSGFKTGGLFVIFLQLRATSEVN